MKASELIQRLEELKKEHGDLKVAIATINKDQEKYSLSSNVNVSCLDGAIIILSKFPLV